MAEQYYCVGDIYHGGAQGTRTYKSGEAFPDGVATDAELDALRASGALKTATELAPTDDTARLIAQKDAELDALRAQLLEANSAKGAKAKKVPDEIATEVS